MYLFLVQSQDIFPRYGLLGLPGCFLEGEHLAAGKILLDLRGGFCGGYGHGIIRKMGISLCCGRLRVPENSPNDRQAFA